MRQKFVLLIFGVCLLFPAAALAQQTGSVSGVILDQTGGVIQGATVRISGDLLPTGRTAQTDANGIYRFPVLLPGRYTVNVESNVGKAARAVEVAVDRDTQLDITLGVTTTETLTVTAATPVVDVKSTAVSFTYRAAEIEALPLQKNYSGLFQLIPGVADNNSFAPAAGGSRQDNKYLIDGVDITNPGFGYLSTEVNGLDIAEFQVKRGAITAEFGRASGFVTNAVSRSGTNDFHGIANLELRPKKFGADENTLNTAGEIVKIPNTISRTFGSGSLGGPLVRDRLFFYGSALWSNTKTTDRTNQLGPVPDRTVRTDEFFGKLTGQPAPSMLINGGFRYRPSDCEFCGIGATQAPTVAMNTDSDAKVATATWNWFLLNRTILEARYIHMEENATNLPLTDLGFQPTWNPNDLASMGQFADTTGPSPVTRGVWNLRSEQVDYKRDEFRASFNQFFDLGTTNHELKAGFGFEEGSETLDRKSNGWGNLSIVGGGTQIQANYYPEQPAQVSPGRTYSLFVQDNISLGTRLVVNAGVLLNRDEFSQTLAQKNTFLTFDFADQIQPRLGVNYQLRPGQGDKAYANWGRYYAMDQKSSSRSLAPSRLFTNDALFNRTTGVLISDIPRASTTNKTIDAGLKPTYTDEWLIGYATPLLDTWGLDVFFINRETFDFIEDVPASLPATGPFHAAQLTGAERKYRSLTIELSRRLANNWALTTSYSWSRLEGNFDLDYASGAVFNTSSAIQDSPGAFVEDRFRKGRLTQDRPHVFKLFASYAPPRVPNLTIGSYLRAQSGAAWAAKGIDWDNGLQRYLEQAGSRRIESWTNFDMLAAYRVPVNGNRIKLSVEGRVLNLFGNLTTLAVDRRQFLDSRIRPAVSAFAVCGTDYACATEIFSAAQTTNQPNSRFGLGSEWAPPRRFILSIRADF